MLNKFILGSANFGLNYGVANGHGKLSYDKINEIVLAAEKHNIRSIDTAPAYGNAECILGKIGIDNFNIITKLRGLRSNNWENVLNSFKFSHKDLRLYDRPIHTILAHDPTEISGVDYKTVAYNLSKLRDLGYATKVGLSIYSEHQCGQITTQFKPDVIQVPFNILDQRAKNSNLLEYLKSKGCEIQVRSIFLQGLLAQNKMYLPKSLNKYSNEVKKLFDFCHSQNISLRTLALKWVDSQSWIDNIVIGLDTIEQFHQLVIDLKSTINLDEKALRDMSSSNLNLIEPYRW